MNDQYKENFKRLLKLKEIEKKVEGVKDLAKGGYPPAVLLFGDWLISGLWDEDRMKLTLAKGDTLLESSDKGDPYMIFGRDPVAALKYYQVAADSNDEAISWEAKYKIAYCRENGYAGLEKQEYLAEKELDHLCESKYSLLCNKNEICRFLDDNAKSANEDSQDEEVAATFIPLPNVRPKLNNPRTEIFKHMGAVIRDRCIGQALLLQIIGTGTCLYSCSGASSWWEYMYHVFVGSSFLAICYTVPLVLFAIWANQVGVRQKQPICSCGKIREAYATSLRKLPMECQMGPDPFSETSYMSRNSHKLKRLFFWLQFILAISFFIIILNGIQFHAMEKFLKSYFFEALFASLVTIIASTLVVAWDVKVPDLGEGTGGLQIPLAILCTLVAPIMADKDCKKEIDRADVDAAFNRAFGENKN